MATAKQQYRDTIFASPTRILIVHFLFYIKTLATDPGAYGLPPVYLKMRVSDIGSYTGTGYLILVTGAVSNYARWLDLDQGIARVAWTQAGSAFAWLVPRFSLQLVNLLTHHPISSSAKPSACTPPKHAHNTSPSPPPPPSLRLPSPSPPPGAPPNTTITISSHTTEAWISWAGGTEFLQDAGNAAHGFSFRGPDLHPAVLVLISAPVVTTGAYSVLCAGHVANVAKTLGVFTLDLGQKADLGTETRLDRGVSGGCGEPIHRGSTLGDLPANLKGKGVLEIANPWSGDDHSNIIIQMNYWSAEMSNLDVTASLFTYFKMNIFGHTSMKVFDNSAEWVNLLAG
ncbi:hypothetical protein B0H19DRAFT_1312685 [Mycena capillaripes]|nr:hypothetical protein B0H19DRAFT_1312685 [Mycena capillaripes]